MIQILSSKLVQMNGEHNGSVFLSYIEPMQLRSSEEEEDEALGNPSPALVDTTVDIDNIHL